MNKTRSEIQYEIIKKIVVGYGGYLLTDINDFKKVIQKVTVKCKNNHTWMATGNSIKRGSWCNQCDAERKKDKSYQQLLDYVKSNKGDLLTDRSDYLGVESYVSIKCSHGHTWSTKGRVLTATDNFCPKCYYENIHNESYIALQKFIIKKEGSLLTDRSNYKGLAYKVKVCCKYGHGWTPKGKKVLDENQWCIKCSVSNTNDLTFEDTRTYVESMGGELLTSREEYKGVLNKVKVRCSKNHEWSALASNLKSAKNWCSKCNSKNGEKAFRSFLNTIYATEFHSVKPKWNKNPYTNMPLELDFYSEDMPDIAFEWDGRQHFEPIKKFGGDNGLVQTQKRDAIKNINCENKGIKLYRIKDPSWNVKEYINFDNFFKYVIEELKGQGLVFEISKDIYKKLEIEYLKCFEKSL